MPKPAQTSVVKFPAKPGSRAARVHTRRRCAAMTTLAKTMFLQVGRKRYAVATFEQASQMFCIARDKMGEGSSKIPSQRIVDENGEAIG
jgi:hypothetical protein